MAYREVPRMEIKEIIRRWQAEDSLRHIAAGTGLSRGHGAQATLVAAREEGLTRDGPAPTEEQLIRLVTMGQSGPRRPKAPRQDELESWADQIYQWLTGDRLQMTRIHELLAAPWLCGVVHVAAALRCETELAQAQQDHGADGGHAAR